MQEIRGFMLDGHEENRLVIPIAHIFDLHVLTGIAG
jgi:hypothetical protein